MLKSMLLQKAVLYSMQYICTVYCIVYSTAKKNLSIVIITNYYY